MGLAEDIVGKINVVWGEQHSPRTAFYILPSFATFNPPKLFGVFHYFTHPSPPYPPPKALF